MVARGAAMPQEEVLCRNTRGNISWEAGLGEKRLSGEADGQFHSSGGQQGLRRGGRLNNKLG